MIARSQANSPPLNLMCPSRSVAPRQADSFRQKMLENHNDRARTTGGLPWRLMRTTKLIRFSKLIATPRRWLKTSASPRTTDCRAVARTVASGLRDGSPAGESTLPRWFNSPLARRIPTRDRSMATALVASQTRALAAKETLRARPGNPGLPGLDPASAWSGASVPAAAWMAQQLESAKLCLPLHTADPQRGRQILGPNLALTWP